MRPLFCAIAIFSAALFTAGEMQVAQAKPTSAKAAKPASAGPRVNWHTRFAPALAQARKTRKPIFVDFYATWCGPCKMLDEYTYTDKAFIQESRKWVMVKLDAEANKENARLAEKYQVSGYPTLTYLKPDGKAVASSVGYWDAKGLIKQMKAAAAKARK